MDMVELLDYPKKHKQADRTPQQWPWAQKTNIVFDVFSSNAISTNPMPGLTPVSLPKGSYPTQKERNTNTQTQDLRDFHPCSDYS